MNAQLVSGLQQLAAVGAAGPQINPQALALARALSPALMQAAPQVQARPQRINLDSAQLHAVAQALQAQVQDAGVAQAMAQTEGVAVVDKPIRRGGRVPAGFRGSEDTLAGGTILVEFETPVLFRPQQLFIPATIAPTWELISCVTAMDSLMVTQNPIPCEVFAQESNILGWRIDTLQIGQNISMTFRNLSSETQRIRGAWYGLYAT